MTNYFNLRFLPASIFLITNILVSKASLPCSVLNYLDPFRCVSSITTNMWVLPSNTTIEDVIIYLLTTVVLASYMAIIRSNVRSSFEESLVITFKYAIRDPVYMAVYAYVTFDLTMAI
jgi:hypothetical protein